MKLIYVQIQREALRKIYQNPYDSILDPHDLRNLMYLL